MGLSTALRRTTAWSRRAGQRAAHAWRWAAVTLDLVYPVYYCKKETRDYATAEEPGSQSWWQTIPGVLTATAGIITAVAGLVVALNQAGILKLGDKWTPPAYNDTAMSAEQIESTPTSPKPRPGAQMPNVSGKPSGSRETAPAGRTKVTFSNEFSTAPWSFQILNIAEADV